MNTDIDKYAHKLSIRNNICYENATDIINKSIDRLKERNYKTDDLVRSAYKYSRNKISQQQDSINYKDKYMKYKKLYKNELVKRGGGNPNENIIEENRNKFILLQNKIGQCKELCQNGTILNYKTNNIKKTNIKRMIGGNVPSVLSLKNLNLFTEGTLESRLLDPTNGYIWSQTAFRNYFFFRRL